MIEGALPMRAFPLLILLAACGSKPQAQPDAKAPPLPSQLCDQTRDGLEKLRVKGALDYDEGGAATIPQAAWMTMGSAEHGSLAQMLAFHAACAQPDGSAQRHVLIRNESGVVLMESDVSTKFGLGSLEED
jgi:hypothetical protein